MKCARRNTLYFLAITCLLTTPVAPLLSGEAVAHLTDFYSGVENWFNFSRSYDISRECSGDAPLRVAYFTRHEGTLWDFIAVASTLGTPWTNVNPSLFQSVFATDKVNYNDEASAERTWQAIGQMYCHHGDILMFGDINSYARPLLQGHCTTPIVLQVTNRFNVCMRSSHLKAYDQLIAQAATWPNVWFVTNNPFEKLYFKSHGIMLPRERSIMLRPVGVSLLPRPASELANKTTKVAVVYNANYTTSFDNTVLIPWIENERLLETDAVIIPKHYGGPFALLNYRAILHIPYQVSTMKMYEGLAIGVVFILPSPALFARLVLELYDPKLRPPFCCRPLIREHPNTWPDYMDWYHQDFRDCHVYFDNWDELKKIIKGEGKYTPEFFAEKGRKGILAMKRSREETLAGFDLLFGEIKKAVCEQLSKPGVWSAGMGEKALR